MRGALIFGGLLFTSTALAYDAAPPHSFAKPTANGKYVLVMLHRLDGPRDTALKKKYGGAWDAIAGAVSARRALEPDLTWVEAPGSPRPPWARTPLMS